MDSPIITTTGLLQEMTKIGRVKKRDVDKFSIFNTLILSDRTTHKTLQKQLQIRPNSISKYIDELIEVGLVSKESATGEGNRGRPVTYLSMNKDRLVALTITIHSRTLTLRLINSTSEVLAEHRLSIPYDITNEGMNRILDDNISRLIDSTPLTYPLCGMVFSLPGWVDQKKKLWGRTARFEHISDLDFSHYEDRYGVEVSVRPIHDTVLNYHIRNDDRFSKGSVVMLSWGWRIINGLGIDGKVFHHIERQFGHIGHNIVNLGPTAKQCNCGSFGCLETEASQWALLEELRHHLGDVPADEIAFAHFIEQCDVSNLECIDNALNYIVVALVNLSRMFYSDHIILTGAFIHNPWICEQVMKRWNDATQHISTPWPNLTLSLSAHYESEVGSVYPIFEKTIRRLIDVNDGVKIK
ncbi:ROK family protein [Vibrio sinensis]|uniref:ROK family protein n=1 Tax=Vibrio sinensis TaxID=2302434 RepID=A0A3A6RDK4_9VIBR|nr:ROK family protein [Vibrio sinensis]RJX75202.1 ROK family protein [Vibrio sinensis]